MKKLGLVSFAFFLIKGIAWLAIAGWAIYISKK